MQIKLIRTPHFFQLRTNIEIELPKIATADIPRVHSKVNNPYP